MKKPTDGEITPTAEAMIQMHELFVSMLAGGFTESQACRILGTWLATLGVGAQGGEE